MWDEWCRLIANFRIVRIPGSARMATLSVVMDTLHAKGSEKTRATYVRHGAPPERTLGVSVADMKVLAKTMKKQQELACELYETGIFDAMYLAGIVADGRPMTKKQLQEWADGAKGMPMIFEYTVPWVTIESAFARELAMQWIGSKKEHVAAAGWCTYAGLATTVPDEALDLEEIAELVESVPDRIDEAANRLRVTMNRFVITVGGYVAPLHRQTVALAQRLGEVPVDVGDTACEIPLATAYIAKMHASGRTAKRKTIRC